MRLAGLLYRVVPPARRPVTWRGALPLVLFLALFAGACVGLEWGGILVFTRPLAFALMAVTPWVWWLHQAGHSGLRGARAVIALLVRLALIATLVLALAQPRAVQESDRLTVLYALDLSDSIGSRAVDAALAFVARTVGARGEDDEAGLVVFGRTASVEVPPRRAFPFDDQDIAINSRVGRDGTNLAQALELAAAMLPEAHNGRVVLISDGVATTGRLGAALDELQERDIPVDVLPIQYEYDQEVWLEKLELPQRIREGETYEVTIILSALTAGSGTLQLTENGQVISREEVEYRPGKNKYQLPLYLREPGYYEYAATIQVPRDADGWRQNNVAMGSLFLKGEGKVLLVLDPEGTPEDHEHLATVLRRAKRLVEMRLAHEMPHDPLSLMPYDCVVFVNVAADAFDALQLQAVHDAVRNQGLGFLMVGGKNSFGPGGYHHTPVEDALPVTMDVTQKKVLPKGALAIVLHTCEFPEGNTWGKRIAKEAIRVLGDQDEVGVLVYDWNGGEKWLFPLTPAGQREQLAIKINQAGIGDMPSFATTMQLGLTGLQKSDAATKHMIIISDGDPSPPPPPMVTQFRNSQISISTVAINPHGGVEQQIMRQIAAATGGRYYFPQDPKKLPSIFVKEAKTLRRSLIQNKTFTPEAEMPSLILKGIRTMPPLHGYVLSTAKPSALTILKAPDEEGEVLPVLAVWRYGLGKAAAFTSDLAPNWARDWVRWELFQPLLRQLLTDISRVDQKSYLQVRTFAAGDTGVLTIEDVHPDDGFLTLEARVTGPDERQEAIPCQQVGPRRYRGEFPLWGRGRYQIVCAAQAGERRETALAGLIIPYSPEYLRFRAAPATLQEIAQRTHGKLLRGDEDGAVLYRRDRPPRASSRPAFPWFLLVLCCLVPLDVGVRRIQIDWALIAAWLRRRRQPESTATMSALLRRKNRVQEALATEEEGPAPPAPPPGAPRPSQPAPPRVKGPAAPEPEAEAAPEDPESTTGRLLARKRKWKKNP